MDTFRLNVELDGIKTKISHMIAGHHASIETMIAEAIDERISVPAFRNEVSRSVNTAIDTALDELARDSRLIDALKEDLRRRILEDVKS